MVSSVLFAFSINDNEGHIHAGFLVYVCKPHVGMECLPGCCFITVYVCMLGGGWHVYHSMHVEVRDQLRNLLFLPSLASALPDEPTHQPWCLLRHRPLLHSCIRLGSLARELQGSTCHCPPTSMLEFQVPATTLSFCGHCGSHGYVVND